jgi:hypothetical protein
VAVRVLAEGLRAVERCPVALVTHRADEGRLVEQLMLKSVGSVPGIINMQSGLRKPAPIPEYLLHMRQPLFHGSGSVLPHV